MITPHTKCRLRLLKQERIKDYLLMEEEFIRNQERLKPQEEKNEEERSKVDDLRGTPMSVGSLEEIIDDNHAIVSTSVGSEHYVSILSFVDKDQLEPGCSVLLNHKVHAVVGVLSDDTDPMVTVMKLEKAPTESTLTLVVWTRRSRRSRRVWSCLSPTLSTMKRWESSLPRVSFSTDLPALARLCWPRLWLIRRVRPSCEWLAVN